MFLFLWEREENGEDRGGIAVILGSGSDGSGLFCWVKKKSGKLLKAEQNNININFYCFLSGPLAKKKKGTYSHAIILVSGKIWGKRIVCMKQCATISFWNEPNWKEVATKRLNSYLNKKSMLKISTAKSRCLKLDCWIHSQWHKLDPGDLCD